MKTRLLILLSLFVVCAACTRTPDPEVPDPYRPPVPEAVDLGLSVKWASFNLGASAPEMYGDYFAWGEARPKLDFTVRTYIGDPFADAASAALGGGWRVPTAAEWRELIDRCTCEWTKLEGVAGRKFSAENGNWIFVPSCGYHYSRSWYAYRWFGYYWSSTPCPEDPLLAQRVRFNAGDLFVDESGSRCYGLSIRPVLP